MYDQLRATGFCQKILVALPGGRRKWDHMRGHVAVAFGFGLFGFSIAFGGINEGLVAYYPFEGNGNDASGNGWHGTNYYPDRPVVYYPTNFSRPGSVWPPSGKRGQGAWFDAASRLKLPQTRLLDGATNATITFWAWFAYPEDGEPLALLSGSYTPPPISTRFSPQYGTAADVGFGQTPGHLPGVKIGFSGEPMAGFTQGEWSMITLVLASSSSGRVCRLYMDAELLHEARNESFSQIGYPADMSALVGGLIGVLDEFRIYSRALERSDILELFYDGSDPNLRIEVSQVRVCWFTPTNKTSQLQYRSTLTTNDWVNLGSAVPGTGYTTCISDAVDGPQRFYRVLYLP
jgi:hypothetical protein